MTAPGQQLLAAGKLDQVVRLLDGRGERLLRQQVRAGRQDLHRGRVVRVDRRQIEYRVKLGVGQHGRQVVVDGGDAPLAGNRVSPRPRPAGDGRDLDLVGKLTKTWQEAVRDGSDHAGAQDA